MGNTVFYKDVKKNPNKITFKEIMSECTSGRSHGCFTGCLYMALFL